MSNFIVPISTDVLLSEAEKENLYLKLIDQLNKDFNLANEAVDFPLSTTPEELKSQLHEKIYRLIQYKFAEYLNLLYIVDVSESEIKKLNGDDLVALSAQVSFLILKREWQKVWFRNRY
jgi:energy-converting hydrogenase A subunit M